MSAPFDYSGLQGVARRLISRFGRTTVTLRHPSLDAIVTPAVYIDPEQNLSTPGAQKRRERTSTVEQTALYVVPDVGVELSTEWFIDDAGKRRAIVRVQRVRPGNTPLVTRLYVGA